MRDSAHILAEVVTISDGLTLLADGLPMRHTTCQHNYITVKGKLSRCHLKNGMVGTVHCPMCKELMFDVANELSLIDIKQRDWSWFAIT